MTGLEIADRSLEIYRQIWLRLCLIWLIGCLPIAGALWLLGHRALQSGNPSGPELLELMSLSVLVLLTAGWYALFMTVLIRQSQAGLDLTPWSLRESSAYLPTAFTALGRRLLLTLASTLTLGVALPAALVYSSTWMIRAVIVDPSALSLHPEISAKLRITLNAFSWLMLLIVAANLAVLLSWVRSGSIDLSILSADPVTLAVSAAVALTLVEPWRVLALTLAVEERCSIC